MKSSIPRPAHSPVFLLSALLLLWGCNPKAKNAGINKKTNTPSPSPSSSIPAPPVSVSLRPPASEGQNTATEETGEQAAKKEEIVGQDVKARGVGAKDTITEETEEQAAKKEEIVGQGVKARGVGAKDIITEETGEQAAKKEEIVGQGVKARGVGAKDIITEETGEQATEKEVVERQGIETEKAGEQDTTVEETGEQAAKKEKTASQGVKKEVTGGQNTTTKDTDEEVSLKALLTEEFIEKFCSEDLRDALRKLRDGTVEINDKVQASPQVHNEVNVRLSMARESFATDGGSILGENFEEGITPRSAVEVSPELLLKQIEETEIKKLEAASLSIRVSCTNDERMARILPCNEASKKLTKHLEAVYKKVNKRDYVYTPSRLSKKADRSDAGRVPSARTSLCTTPRPDAAKDEKRTTEDGVDATIADEAQCSALRISHVSEVDFNGGDLDVDESYENDKYETTILHLAISDEAASKELVEALIKKGAKVDAKDARENSPLHLAARYGKVELARLLLTVFEARNNGNEAVPSQCTESIESPLSAACKARNLSEEVPLHCAVKSQNLEIAQLLLEKEQTSINCEDDAYMTPLDLAKSLPADIRNSGSYAQDSAHCFGGLPPRTFLKANR